MNPRGTFAERYGYDHLQTGIPAIFIEADLEKSGEAYRTLGKLLGREEKGAALGNYCDRVFAGAKAKMAEIPESERISFA